MHLVQRLPVTNDSNIVNTFIYMRHNITGQIHTR